ncbi:ABC-2 type transport system permease protein [Nocardia tenerifensis]|uniref:ABC-2 type transport system permease protein n=1 Tax=Nocardia tenerifensis TaxID=228006 RepID=A0A318KB45_9NOCA|nr:ABC transporter permease subunit [Nocardia tenerifensis]PXX54109.1 ABC-2 type transport system permease protein [Nocardia tenerifensis]
MTRSVFTQTLKEQRRGLVGWSVGVAVVALVYLPSFHSLKEQGSLDNIKQNGVYDALGIGDFASGTGFLHSMIYSMMGLLLLLIFAVTFAARSAGQEENGTLDLLLAQPISRIGLLGQRFAALAVQTAVVTTALALAVIAGADAGELGVPVGNIVAASAGLGLLALAVGTLTLLVGAATGKRSLTLGFASVIALAGFLANTLGADWVRKISPFYYAIGDAPVINGWNIGHLLVLMAVSAIALALALRAFQRRDLAV